MISGLSNVIFFLACLSDSRFVALDPLCALGVMILDAPWTPSTHAATVGENDFPTRYPTYVLFEENVLVSSPFLLTAISPAACVVSLNFAAVIDPASN